MVLKHVSQFALGWIAYRWLTSTTVCSRGLKRDSSYSSSLGGFCRSFLFVSLSPGPWNKHHEPDLTRVLLLTYSAYSDTEVNQRIDRILLGV